MFCLFFRFVTAKTIHMRDTMIFYRSFYEAIQHLSINDQAILYDAIFSYGLDFKEPEMYGVTKTIWTLIKPQIDANIKRFNNGKKPKLKQLVINKEAIQEQEKSKIGGNNNNNNNNNKNVFKPPTFDEVSEYCIERKNNIDVSKFVNFYESKGWMVGKNKMKDWKACVRTWEKGSLEIKTNDQLYYENVMKQITRK